MCLARTPEGTHPASAAVTLPSGGVHGRRWTDPNSKRLELEFQVLPDGAADWWVTLPAIVAEGSLIEVMSWPAEYGVVLVRARLRDESLPAESQLVERAATAEGWGEGAGGA